MDDSTTVPAADRLTALVEEREHAAARTCLEGLADADPEVRKTALRDLRTLVDEQGAGVRPLVPTLRRFLEDDGRAVRLTTAKLFVAVAANEPDAVVEAVPALGERLADDAEFYYVRARCAEALGYVALEHPDEVASPDVLADLRIGLSFDETDVRPKLAKALACVAIGEPTRLDHHVETLAAFLGDEHELVRYHLATALVAIGCERPGALGEASGGLVARVEDEAENDYVRGRAAEALGLLARADGVGAESESDVEASVLQAEFEVLEDADTAFLAERARYAARALAEPDSDPAIDSSDETGEIGNIDAIRRTTDEIAATVSSPDADDECPHCGLALPDGAPPMCPRCGAPY
ncbi:HEAT repeat domain-containing protein [Halopiger xanaduensis]|uniref:Heat domain containing protein n=1 Tax=Halopiger xanaduensis (strain DSM 18323 / JCM 14033 / SH-6) TaxID=797210 RepID=F8D9E3_HALXS|nr:HEAT repeat domain-containing protein [Halopiger xanaduensis]AEH36884.1 heat domain containing protein [Halopiger xanaduensis SH-6]